MTDYRSMYDRDYIGHWDLGGRDVAVTISKVNAGELTAVGGRKSKKPIVHFRNGPKPLICNKTNAKTIAAMYGNMVEEWVGKRITLFVSMTRNPDGGGETECIRIRPKMPSAGQDDAFEEGAQPPLSRRTAPAPAPQPSNAAASKSPPASPSGDAVAPTTMSDAARELIASIPGIRGKNGADAAQVALNALPNEFERSVAQAELDARVRDLKAKSQTRRDADARVAEIESDKL